MSVKLLLLKIVIYGEQGEDEWTRQAMGMTEEEYKEFMGEEHFNRNRYVKFTDYEKRKDL